jgi:hypothetical protein
MRTTVQRVAGGIAVVGAALALAACGRAAGGADAELDRDLALAASDGLAPVAPAATAVVSAVEANLPTPKATPKTRRAPKAGTARPPRKVVEPTPSETATEVAYEPSSDPVVVAESPEPTTTAPVPAPAPRPVPATIPTGEGSGGWGEEGDGGHGGGGLGGVIGVVIRGGSIGDDDHCEIHRRPGRPRMGVLINDRIPTGTFPRSGGGIPGGGRFPRF